MKTTTPAPPSATRLTSVIAAVSARAEHIKPARPWLSDAGAYSDAACELLAEMTADRDRLAAEVENLRKHVNATTAVSLTTMLESFESARAYSEQRAITDDDPGPALADASAWKDAAEAVAKLRGGAGS